MNFFKKTRLLLGVWGLFTLFDLFLVRDASWVFENFQSERFLVNYIASALAFLGLLVLIASHLLRGRKKIILSFFILFVPLMVQVSYFWIYRKFVSSFGFRAFFEEPGMVFSLWLDNIPVIRIFAALIMVFSVMVILKRIQGGFHVLTQVFSGFVILVVTSLMVFSWYSVPVFQNSVLAYAGSYLELAKQKSYESFQLSRPVITAPETHKALPDIIYIIGESTVLSHMSLFGYERDTTPGLSRLEKEGLIVAFDNCISIGLQTRLSVPYMMVGLQGIDPKGIIYTYPTIINYAKARGYHTAFITAQDLFWGRLKELLIDKDVDDFENGTQFNPALSVHKGANDLDVLEKGVLPFMAKARKPFLMVVQMDGSHYPFSEHSEQEYKKFLPEEEPNGVNAFDNSVLYTDIYLTRLIEHVRQNNPSAWIFFSPDHGQNMGGKNGFYNDSFSNAVIHNPLIVSAPKDFIPILEANQHAPLSQADIVPTMLELMDLKPVKPLDGFSLLGQIPMDRLRVCSTYMPTFHNTPESVLVFNDLSYYYFDQARGSVLLKDGKTAMKFDDLEPEYREIFLRRM
ncbi:MAG: phosphoethanolamine transferase [Proteobacteria bacterium]|nr:phosphoethanolamine transferase [Pseudomonadota bacterium]